MLNPGGRGMGVPNPRAGTAAFGRGFGAGVANFALGGGVAPTGPQGDDIKG